MMRILYDNQIFKTQKFGGISRYFAELMKGLNASREFETVPARFYTENKHLREAGLTHYDNFSDNYKFRGKARVDNYLKNKEEKSLIKMIKEGKFNFFHPTYYNSSLIQYLPETKPFVLTVYDMIHELYYDNLFEQVHIETKCKLELIPKAKHIIAISQSTKNDILHFYPELDERKITVIHLGSSFVSTNDATNVGLPAKYILFVGNRIFYKNFKWMLQSITGFLKNSNIHLVCAGAGSFTEFEQSLIREAGLEDKVIHVKINNDGDLVTVYKNAACFVFPSLFEGFGIPILEAFSCSCPVILPNASCFPEIGGDAVAYFEQGNADSLEDQLNNVINNKEFSEALRQKGHNRLQIFNWENTVDKHMQLYTSLSAT